MLKIAAILTALLGLAHSYLGERYILIRLFRRDNLPKLFGAATFTQQTLRLAWHITTVLALGLALLLWLLASSQPATAAPLQRVIALTLAVSGAIALLFSRGRHLSWVVFFACAALAWPWT